MVTKSFKRELKLNTKNAEKFLIALDNSKQVAINSRHKIHTVEDKDLVAAIVKNASRG